MWGTLTNINKNLSECKWDRFDENQSEKCN